MKVRRFDFLRFFVTGDSGTEYLVDLANPPKGECDCEHFQIRLAPFLTFGGDAECKHVKAARAYLWRAIRGGRYNLAKVKGND